MEPEEKSIEAFELISSAPVIGYQSHPEAFNRSDSPQNFNGAHLNLLGFMAKAGIVFNRKQHMLSELSLFFIKRNVLHSQEEKRAHRSNNE